MLPVFAGHDREGTAAGAGYLDFGDLVVALTPPGGPRMPNGVETDARIAPGTAVRIGLGRLLLGTVEIRPGALWEPVPEVRKRPVGGPFVRPDPVQLAGRGPGLTPAGDDILCGYVAGLFLFHDRRAEAAEIALAAAGRTTKLSATLLRHASQGELPEPAHAFLTDGDSRPLAVFGHSSGQCLRLGLMLAAAAGG
ncbi:MAG: DUF2877 domain-containing protein [Candidatus Dormibacteraeota bacterium]|nr:DUF2877 domain-containing protein [Candidatus Dormibacteraeota bacterium]